MNDEISGKLKFHLVEEMLGAKIRVLGIGGGGGNAVNRMIEAGIEGVEFIAVNTDLQALSDNRAGTKLQIGGKITKGLGSGGRPEIGKQSAVEDTEKLIELIQGADMVFLTTGLGGGTGTGSTPILAHLASEMDILAIAIVTLPFDFEGRVRAKQAEEGLKELKGVVDTVISIPNERLLQTVNLDTSIQDAFKMADDILRQAVQGISDLITKPGLINLDFADVKSIMKGMGMAFMGTGLASGENRAVDAAQKAISSPLLVDTSIEGAKGVLINITGGRDLTLHEVSRASELIHRMAHPEANIIFGTVIDNSMKEMVKVTVIATGFETEKGKEVAVDAELPRPLRQTPPAFRVDADTPTYLFEPKGGKAPLWEPPVWEKQYEPYETPTFIRRSKHSTLRKNPDDLR
ncbi:MAG: cell division protein FtsZ [Candidatus Aminicenantes bacterium RBG_19FT_COMBO_59_29]|jgi:cell division protein FtsZ|nr:MAG: cell division protein FtsZ [Candidatus Aminicenantes bacterium RBG_19FT_COMBO_59_29]